jgi:hypothetical protein
MSGMVSIPSDDSRALAAFEAIHGGDIEALARLLVEYPDLAIARVVDRSCGDERTLLHVVTDWPGHFPNGRQTVATLVGAGADVDAPFGGSHAETALQWAASSDDVEVLDALVEAGADIEAPGSVIDGGSPLSDAVAFGQSRAASRLIEVGAEANLWQAAGLGSSNVSSRCSPLTRRPAATTSPTPSGAPAREGSARRRSGSSRAVPTSTGWLRPSHAAGRGHSRRRACPRRMAAIAGRPACGRVGLIRYAGV